MASSPFNLAMSHTITPHDLDFSDANPYYQVPADAQEPTVAAPPPVNRVPDMGMGYGMNGGGKGLGAYRVRPAEPRPDTPPGLMHGPAAQGRLELVSMGSYEAIDGANYQTLVREKEIPRDIPVPSFLPMPAMIAPRAVQTVVVPKNRALNYPEHLNEAPAVRELLAVGQVQHEHRNVLEVQFEDRLVTTGAAGTALSAYKHKTDQDCTDLVAGLTATEDVVRAALLALQKENAAKLHAFHVKSSENMLAYEAHARAVLAAKERQWAQELLAFEQKHAAVMGSPRYIKPATGVMHAKATVMVSEQVPYDRSICTVNRNTEAARMAQECRALASGGAPARVPATARVIAVARVPVPARAIAAVPVPVIVPVPAPARAQAAPPSVVLQAVEALVDNIEGGAAEPVFVPVVRLADMTDEDFKRLTGNAKRRHKRLVDTYNGIPPPKRNRKAVADDPLGGVV